MAFFTQQRNGFTTVTSAMRSVVSDMIVHGFTVKFPASYDATATASTFKVVLEASSAVDPLNSTQPWRICFDVIGDEIVAAYVGTPLQIHDDGTITNVTDSSGALAFKAGQVGRQDDTISTTDSTTGFVNRVKRVGTSGASFPINYRLTITDHGFFVGLFEGNWASMIYNTSVKTYFNWLLVQRPVNKLTGATLVTGKCPVFCVNKVDDNYWRFIVRESDIPHPTNAVAANAHTPDAFRIINTSNQQSITEDKKYLVSFMNNLNTPRFRYTEELDIVGIVSADVIMESIQTQMTVYGAPRVYTSMPGSNTFNTGVKLLVWTA